MEIVSPAKTDKLASKPILALQLSVLGSLLLLVYKNFVVVPVLDYIFGASALLLLNSGTR